MIGKVFKWIWRRKIALIAGGLLICLLLAGVSGDKSYQVRVSFVYPGVENGLYPDGQRLLRDDLISTENIENALQDMYAKGWYQGITATHVRDNLRVSENLDSLVQDRVNSMSAQGKEFTYYNNEFILSFHQPRVLNLKDSSDLFGLFREDRSKEFTEAMVRSIMRGFLEDHAEGEIFRNFSQYIQVGDADFEDAVNLYTDKALLCINYLDKKRANDNTFVSSITGMSFGDLVTGFESLQNVQIQRLLEYNSAEYVTRSLDEYINGLKVEIEDLRLTEDKKADEQAINQRAMLEYDHTFSENIIIVAVNEENGLYQARPKTAYDTVTQQTLNAGVSSVSAGNEADNNERLIGLYTDSMTAGNAARKLETAESLLKDIEVEYNRLCDLTVRTIEDYLNEINNNYITTSEVENEVSIVSLAIKLCVYFCAGVCLTAALCLIIEKIFKRRKNDKKA